jgi:Ni/Co efflux regulator RcnB
MNTKTKPMSVPDIGGLLGKISEKRDELPKTERQHVVTAPSTEKQENAETEKQKNDKTFTQKNDKTFTQKNDKTINQKNTKIGRPSVKDKKNIEYVRLGCHIPKKIRQKAADALTYEKFKTPEGKPVKTLDELVTMAMAQLLKE